MAINTERCTIWQSLALQILLVLYIDNIDNWVVVALSLQGLRCNRLAANAANCICMSEKDMVFKSSQTV